MKWNGFLYTASVVQFFKSTYFCDLVFSDQNVGHVWT